MTQSGRYKSRYIPWILVGVLGVAACSPTVKLQAPDEPIRFDVNINITEQKRLEIDRELLDLIRQNPTLFGLDPSDLPKEPKGIDQ